MRTEKELEQDIKNLWDQLMPINGQINAMYPDDPPELFAEAEQLQAEISALTKKLRKLKEF